MSVLPERGIIEARGGGVAPIACLSVRRSRKRIFGSRRNASCACCTPIAELSVMPSLYPERLSRRIWPWTFERSDSPVEE